uniref:Uncharacterized protein n=1 Tax=uncultured marine virus TaxID=186617 RepID=A0A0F7L9D5_9VIRU|nr:hypothetical protein [uncultured marine virus]
MIYILIGPLQNIYCCRYNPNYFFYLFRLFPLFSYPSNYSFNNLFIFLSVCFCLFIISTVCISFKLFSTFSNFKDLKK